MGSPACFEKVIKNQTTVIGMASDTGKELFNSQIDQICEQMGIARHEAFPRWICQNVLRMADESQIDEAVSVDGKNDYGVDVFYAQDSSDATERYVCWAQAKFSENLDHIVDRDEMEGFAGTIHHLKNCPDMANRTFKQKSIELARTEAKYPRIKKRMIFAVAGRFSEQVKDLLKDADWMEAKFGPQYSSEISLEIFDLDRILSYITTPPTPQVKIEFSGSAMERSDAVTGKKSIVGYVSAELLVRLARENSETLFLENPRQTLGADAPTYKAILNTLSSPDARKRFWKLNNGITAICGRFERIEHTYIIENFKIVNGRQTTYSLERSIYPIDDVFLMMTIHEAVDDEERNQISQATNTQNPIKPVDLVSNYPEMTGLALQCKERFPEFYFERQSRGFTTAKRSLQVRVTRRRVLEKNSIARAYYAYMIDPSQATMPEKELFSTTSTPNHYEMVFKDRKIEELIIPHIFAQMLSELHKKWCGDLKKNPTAEISRKKEIIGKSVIKYFILCFIHESMIGLEDSQRESIKRNMVEKFRNLRERDSFPQEFLDITESAYEFFMLIFNVEKKQTWPQDLLKKTSSEKYEVQDDDVPTPVDMMYALREKGRRLLPDLLRTRRSTAGMTGDPVQKNLLRLC